MWGAAQIVVLINLAKKTMSEKEFLEIARQNYQKLQALKKEQSFYEYEKNFDEMWVEFGRETLEKSIGEIGEDRRKKKFESRYGSIEISKSHKWSESNGFQVTPYLQELGVYSGQEDNFESASKNLLKFSMSFTLS